MKQQPLKRIKTAFILAAGFGTRLEHLTKDIPKPLVIYKGRPMIENVIYKLESSGITDIFINTHHHHGKMYEYFENRKSSSRIKLLYEKEILGTGGAIKNAQEYLSNEEDFFIYNCDVDCEIDLSLLENFHFSKNSSVTLAVQARKSGRSLLGDPEGALIGLTRNGNDIIHKNGSFEVIKHLGFCGIQIVKNEIFRHFPPNEQIIDIISVYMSMVKYNIRIYTYDISDVFWKDLGTPQNL